MLTSAGRRSHRASTTAMVLAFAVLAGSAPSGPQVRTSATGPAAYPRRPAATPSPCLAGGRPCARPAPAPDAPTRTIREIQGKGHLSPLRGERVSRVSGVVTAVADAGFWLQDPHPDDDPATSEALFVATGAPPDVEMGDAVWVDGRVREARPTGPKAPSRTQIDATALGVTARGRPLPPPVTIGRHGRRPPDRVIDDDARGDLETSGRFQPDRDGADFFESLEGMRVRVANAVAIGPTDPHGRIPIHPDTDVDARRARSAEAVGGTAGLPSPDPATGRAAGKDADGDGAEKDAATRTRAQGLLQRPDDPNPERLAIGDALAPTPKVDTGHRFTTAVTGVLDYEDGLYTILSPRSVAAVPAGVERERTRPQAPGELAVATLNAHNLDPGDPPSIFRALARQITDRLRSPDLILVAEVQDNSGDADDGTVAADQTVAELINAISAAGGPPYYWRSIDPRDNADGGPPGGNIRVGFLFHTERGLDFVHRPGGGPDTPVSVTGDGAGTARLTVSPGRIEPDHPAFTDSRKPLAAEFRWQGRPLFAVAAHWSGTGLDDPLYGRRQPPRAPSAAQHRREADRIRAFVNEIRDVDPEAAVVVGGDFNTADFAPALRDLAAGLVNPARRLPPWDRYTHIVDGNAVAADHILLSPALARRPHEIDIVHTNADYADRPTDRDPVVVRIGPGGGWPTPS